jgi:hypothetical protein
MMYLYRHCLSLARVRYLQTHRTLRKTSARTPDTAVDRARDGSSQKRCAWESEVAARLVLLAGRVKTADRLYHNAPECF